MVNMSPYTGIFGPKMAHISDTDYLRLSTCSDRIMLTFLNKPDCKKAKAVARVVRELCPADRLTAAV